MTITSELCEFVAKTASRVMLEKKPLWVSGNISEFDQPLLMGLTKLTRPKKVVEIGVASGWSGCLFMDILEANGQPAEYIGIDLSPTYYIDPSRKTGAVISELFPSSPINAKLLLGSFAIDLQKEIGKDVDLAFIDGNHMHPWAILDFLSLMPTLSPSAYVLIHDLNLSTYERHNQANRGPKYLYECWPFEKLHSSQNLPMIGAVRMPQRIDEEFLTLLLNTTYTPWEAKITPSILVKIASSIGNEYGSSWEKKFQRAFDQMNLTTTNAIKNDGHQDFIKELIRIVSNQPNSPAHLEMLHSATFVFPESSKLFHHLSVLQYRAGNIEEALTSSLRAVNLAKTNAHCISFLGELYLASDNLIQASEYLRKAILLQDDVSIFHYRLALMCEKSGLLNEAISSARRANQLTSNNSDFEKLLQRLSN
ncbi:class I SAM-dependent methyltransferase [Yersinia aleksiciae]|uniref:class I SAM-dependent methyltransferase n=1 Tax=Yersinia aleksiciae TaxID=263819 RepID=UPI0011A2F3E0|nr:class I SAM-dependent methyltransferase [Yersinia aleksiciae]MDN0123965.1 class I SAM-dependent methyltransferase [Yersinia aleksiciae]